MIIQNCGQCRHLASKTVLGLAMYGCGHSKWKARQQPVVPQDSQRDIDSGAHRAAFPRVPEWCPLPDAEAHKQPESPEVAA